MVPDPGAGSMPPGFEQFTTIMGWGKWIALGILVLSLILAGVRLGMAQNRGDDASDQAGAIGKVLVGVIVVSAAFTIVAFLA